MKLNEIKSLSVYSDLDTLAQDFYEDYDGLTEEQRDYLSAVTDYEDYRFAVLNGCNVLVYSGLDGTVYGMNTVDEIIKNALEDYEED